MPIIPGVEDFQGQSFHTARWPHDPVSFVGKRVAVIGTGATGVQTIQEVAKTAGSLTVFQRTPNWCAPLLNSKIGAAEMQRIRAGYPEMFQRCQETFACFLHTPDPRGTFEVGRGTRGVLGKALRRAGFRYLAGQLQGHPDQPRGERTAVGFRRPEDPPSGQKPNRRGETDPEKSWLWHPARAVGDEVLRGLQPGQRDAGRHRGNAN